MQSRNYYCEQPHYASGRLAGAVTEQQSDKQSGVSPSHDSRVDRLDLVVRNQNTAGSYILAGAIDIGTGTELVPTEAIERRQTHRIHELVRRFTKVVNEAREEIERWRQRLSIEQFTDVDKCEK